MRLQLEQGYVSLFWKILLRIIKKIIITIFLFLHCNMYNCTCVHVLSRWWANSLGKLRVFGALKSKTERKKFSTVQYVQYIIYTRYTVQHVTELNCSAQLSFKKHLYCFPKHLYLQMLFLNAFSVKRQNIFFLNSLEGDPCTV